MAPRAKTCCFANIEVALGKRDMLDAMYTILLIDIRRHTAENFPPAVCWAIALSA
jgi:hypothetical protein